MEIDGVCGRKEVMKLSSAKRNFGRGEPGQPEKAASRALHRAGIEALRTSSTVTSPQLSGLHPCICEFSGHHIHWCDFASEAQQPA